MEQSLIQRPKAVETTMWLANIEQRLISYMDPLILDRPVKLPSIALTLVSLVK